MVTGIGLMQTRTWRPDTSFAGRPLTSSAVVSYYIGRRYSESRSSPRTQDARSTMAKTGKSIRTPESHLPMTAATFQILMALSGDERHGYAIMKEVSGSTAGAVRLGPGTLYGSLKRLLEDGLVEEGAERSDPELGDERRRYYRITKFGMTVARAEARRMESVVRTARQKRLLGQRTA